MTTTLKIGHLYRKSKQGFSMISCFHKVPAGWLYTPNPTDPTGNRSRLIVWPDDAALMVISLEPLLTIDANGRVEAGPLRERYCRRLLGDETVGIYAYLVDEI